MPQMTRTVEQSSVVTNTVTNARAMHALTRVYLCYTTHSLPSLQISHLHNTCSGMWFTVTEATHQGDKHPRTCPASVTTIQFLCPVRF
ncbi:hypothetical protein E2C01_099626 [Portunus trituberculatus]|uniref:Uncharacterized protein n=1 Tax=Portunus trituberculatus TaxID=210409 RepID=A0A5B7KB92_PORTR|nr:hypothetical protein [Portunus trituberculatus]